MNNHRITIWDVILASDSLHNWNEIESSIAYWVTSDPDSDGSEDRWRVLGYLKGSPAYSVLTIPFNSITTDNYDFSEFEYTGPFQDIDIPWRIAQYIINVTNRYGKDSWNEDDLRDYLLEQLHILETEFRDYLLKEVNASNSYIKNSNVLLHNIIRSERFNSDDQKLFTTILNFNYTDPLGAKRRVDGDKKVRMVNIHGSLSRSIIFGIDGRQCMDDRFALPFTKTFRLLGLTNEDSLDIFEVEPSKLGFGSAYSNPNIYDEIVFYGHSLSESDYSYFQSIFDSVNLYNSNTILHFYYKTFSDKLDAATDMYTKVTNLLTTYGETLDNPDHGKNLIHKLLLECRLLVSEYSAN